MPTTRSSSSRSEAMYALIREYLDQPDMTQREFCINHQIAYSTFQRYLSKYRQQVEQAKSDESTGRFVPIALPGLAIAASSQFPCELVWPDGMIARFGESPSPEYLMALIKAGRSGL